MPLIDSHIHLDFPEFDHDRDAILLAARQRGIQGFVIPAVSAKDWPRIQALVQTELDVSACYGLHPCFTPEHLPRHIEELQLWLEREKPVAVGECGLDFYGEHKNTEGQQRYYFEAQVDLARDSNLPLVLHARRSVDAVLKVLRDHRVYRGVVHSFSGSLQQAKQAIDQGLMIGVGGAITYSRARKLRSVIARLPLESLVLETDAPDQPTAKNRGGRNEPVFLVEVLDTLDAIRDEPRELLAAETSANTARLFSLSD